MRSLLERIRGFCNITIIEAVLLDGLRNRADVGPGQRWDFLNVLSCYLDYGRVVRAFTRYFHYDKMLSEG